MATLTAPITGKRKRQAAQSEPSRPKKLAVEQSPRKDAAPARKQAVMAQAQAAGEMQRPKPGTTVALDEPIFVQIITGSYERSLHGTCARVPRSLLTTGSLPGSTTSDASKVADSEKSVTFSDTFLFSAHASSIRCLALSPPTESDKRYLATGSSDERINVYSVSTVPPAKTNNPALPSLASTAITENPRNRSLGSLIHHDRAITRLEFPAKGKLFSAAEDNTIAISRTRDWTVLSSIKAPIPKPQGRPSGDTAGPGETPAGVNDFAIHPSQKLMISVGRGERCLRLWNLMTGKKAGVLNFDRDLLTQVGEGKYGSGEGRQILWDKAGENYVVGFERGAAVFNVDSHVKAIIKPEPSTKLHRMQTVQFSNVGKDYLAVSTEDGRILFFDLAECEPIQAGSGKLPSCKLAAQLGGRQAGVTGRIKDFDILQMPPSGQTGEARQLAVTVSSDGAIRLWRLPNGLAGKANLDLDKGTVPQHVGTVIAMLETGSRITCLGAFVMDGKAENEALDGEGEAEIGAGREEGVEDDDKDA